MPHGRITTLSAGFFPQLQVLEVLLELPTAPLRLERAIFEQHFLPKPAASISERLGDDHPPSILDMATLHTVYDLHSCICDMSWVSGTKEELDQILGSLLAPNLQVSVHFRVGLAFYGAK